MLLKPFFKTWLVAQSPQDSLGWHSNLNLDLEQTIDSKKLCDHKSGTVSAMASFEVNRFIQL